MTKMTREEGLALLKISLAGRGISYTDQQWEDWNLNYHDEETHVACWSDFRERRRYVNINKLPDYDEQEVWRFRGRLVERAFYATWQIMPPRREYKKISHVRIYPPVVKRPKRKAKKMRPSRRV